MQVTIIGGGIIGLNCAYYLQQSGYHITIIDEGSFNSGCSYGNMGYISPSHFIPLATPGIVAQGLKWMLSSSSPFYIKPRLNADLIRWGYRFWRSARRSVMERHIGPLNNLLQLSRHLMNDMKQDLNNDFGLIEKGCFMLYRNEKTGDHEKHLADEANRMGLETIHCTAAEVQAYEPEVEVKVAGGVLYKDDCHLHAPSLMKSLRSHLEQKGVQFAALSQVTGFQTNGNQVTGITTETGTVPCGQLILAGGSWLPQLSKKLGIRLLLQPGKGYSFENDGMERNLQYPSILVDDRVATTPVNRWLRIGGTMELSGHSHTILMKRVEAIHTAFKKYYPGMEVPLPAQEKVWYGYRPVTPDGLPYIGRHALYNNIVIAGGHAMLGMAAANATGLLVSQLLQDKEPEIVLDAFHPARFG